MSYDIENKYKILPRKSYEIIRNCLNVDVKLIILIQIILE